MMISLNSPVLQQNRPHVVKRKTEKEFLIIIIIISCIFIFTEKDWKKKSQIFSTILDHSNVVVCTDFTHPSPDVVCTASTLCQVSNSSYLDGSVFDIFPRFLSSNLQSVDIFPTFHSVVCWHSHIHGRASSFFFLPGWDGQSRCQNSKTIFIFQDSFWSVLILVVEIVKPSHLA